MRWGWFGFLVWKLLATKWLRMLRKTKRCDHRYHFVTFLCQIWFGFVIKVNIGIHVIFFASFRSDGLMKLGFASQDRPSMVISVVVYVRIVFRIASHYLWPLSFCKGEEERWMGVRVGAPWCTSEWLVDEIGGIERKRVLSSHMSSSSSLPTEKKCSGLRQCFVRRRVAQTEESPPTFGQTLSFLFKFLHHEGREMLLLLDKHLPWPWYNSFLQRIGYSCRRTGCAFVRNDAKMFRFCSSKYANVLPAVNVTEFDPGVIRTSSTHSWRL
jgi:hypothetical protein